MFFVSIADEEVITQSHRPKPHAENYKQQEEQTNHSRAPNQWSVLCS